MMLTWRRLMRGFTLDPHFPASTTAPGYPEPRCPWDGWCAGPGEVVLCDDPQQGPWFCPVCGAELRRAT